MRWLRRLAILALAIGAIAVLRVTYFRAAPVPVTVVGAARGTVESLVANNKAGSITARRRASIGPEIGGRVARVAVREGARVRRGDVLLVLADADARTQVDLQAQAVAAARWTARQACDEAALAARELSRARELARDQLVSRQSLDAAESRRDTSAAACESATAQVGYADAAVDVARTSLGKTIVRAPFDGVVSKVDVEVGEWLTPAPAGMVLPGVIEIIDTQSIYVRAPLDETDLARVRVGLPVRITLDAFPGRAFAGRLTYVSAYVSEVEQQNRTFDVEAEFDDVAFARSLPPGTSADVEIILGRRDDVIRVPTSAVLQGGRVLVLREETLVSVPIKTGLSNWEYSEVTEGLTAGERVVVSLDRVEVREGARARVAAAAEP
jgi:HlyD family secretion protein